MPYECHLSKNHFVAFWLPPLSMWIMISGRGASPRPSSTPSIPACSRSARLSQLSGSLPSGQSMPLLISLPIWTMSGMRVGVAKGRDRVARVLEDRLHQLLVRLALPGLRDELLAGVGPGVGVVVVQQELEAQLLRVLGQGDGVFEVVRQPGRRVEQAQANPVVAVVLEDLQARLGLPVVLEDRPLLLGLPAETTGPHRSRSPRPAAPADNETTSPNTTEQPTSALHSRHSNLMSLPFLSHQPRRRRLDDTFRRQSLSPSVIVPKPFP